MKTESISRLQSVLSGGGFAVTAECGPPRGADPEWFAKKANCCRDVWMPSM